MPYKNPEVARAKNRERIARTRAKAHAARYGADSGDMRGKHSNHARSSASGKWNKLGVHPNKHGYLKVRVGVGHPLADPKGYTYLHLLVWVGAGRPQPQEGEELHHKDEDKSNNRIENLELLTATEHAKHHNKTRPRVGGKFVKPPT